MNLVQLLKQPGAASEASSSDAARLDAVEQRMENFSEEQNNMKEQLLIN